MSLHYLGKHEPGNCLFSTPQACVFSWRMWAALNRTGHLQMFKVTTSGLPACTQPPTFSNLQELPRPIAVKLCHMIAISVNFIMQVQKFGASPKKLGANNMQNSARFQITSDFDREYLRNGSSYPKSENVLIKSDSSRVPRKKSGELW